MEKYKVTIFYTAPTAIRALERSGDKWPKGRDLSSLRLLGTVGEPINPEAWMWYYTMIGNSRCPIVDMLPKTRSGKIMRRILRKIASGEIHDMGDVITLADPSVVEVLVRERE